MFRPTLAAGTIALAAALLAGCSLLPSPTTTTPGAESPSSNARQTLKEACDEILPVVLDVNTRLSSAYTELQADPSKAGPLLHDISDDMHAAIDKLENDEAVAAMNAAVDSLDAMIVEIDKAIAGQPDQAALIATASEARDDFAAIDPLCQGAQ